MGLQMSGPAGMRHVKSMGYDLVTGNPGLFDADSGRVPLLAGAKAYRQAIYEKGGGQASGSLAHAPVFNLLRFQMIGRDTLTIFHAPVHQCLQPQAFFTVSRAIL